MKDLQLPTSSLGLWSGLQGKISGTACLPAHACSLCASSCWAPELKSPQFQAREAPEAPAGPGGRKQGGIWGVHGSAPSGPRPTQLLPGQAPQGRVGWRGTLRDSAPAGALALPGGRPAKRGFPRGTVPPVRSTPHSS